jgi:hypothetical protein
MRITSILKCSLIAFASAAAWAQAQGAKPAPSTSSPQSATQFYLEYRAAFDKASALDDVLPFWAAAKRKEAEAMPALVRGQGLQSMKLANPVTAVTVLKEENTVDGAKLMVEGIRPDKKKKTGLVTLVKEGGAWKLAAEHWNSASPDADDQTGRGLR